MHESWKIFGIHMFIIHGTSRIKIVKVLKEQDASIFIMSVPCYKYERKETETVRVVFSFMIIFRIIKVGHIYDKSTLIL